MELWRNVWRTGFAPVLPTAGLVALRDALARDDEHLLQGETISPPPLAGVLDWPPEGACAIGWCGWRGEGLETVGEVEEFFSDKCYQADQRLGEPAAVRHFLNAYDDWPRDEMRRQLLPEIDRVLAERGVPESLSA